MRALAAPVLALLVGCRSDRARPPPRVDLSPHRGVVVARVGDLALTDLDVAAVAAERHVTARAALDLLVRDALLAVEARRSHLVNDFDLADDAWRARVQRLLAVEVEDRYSDARVPAAMLEAALEVRRVELLHGGLRRVVHVLLVVAADAGVADTEAARARLLTFRDALVTATNGHPTATQFRQAAQRLGGVGVRIDDLPAFDRQGRTANSAISFVAPFADAVWSLGAGEVLTPPFTTPFGVHVALLLEEVPPVTRTEAEARDIVRSDIVLHGRADAARTLVVGLRQRARVEIREAALRQVERLARRP